MYHHIGGVYGGVYVYHLIDEFILEAILVHGTNIHLSGKYICTCIYIYIYIYIHIHIYMFVYMNPLI
jgi:hypothetical protein